MTENTYIDSKKTAENNDLSNTTYFKYLGGGVNKKAHLLLNSSWVVLSAPISKKRVIEAEIEQILKLRQAGVDTPDLGTSSATEALFQVSNNKDNYIAFLEQAIDGFEIPRPGTAFSEENIIDFGRSVAQFFIDQNTFSDAKEKRKASLQSITKLKGHLEKEDIPDFQVRFDKKTGRILTLDPGDPLNSENAQAKHLRWLSLWEKEISDTRYLTTQWNKKHPDKKTSRTDW